MKPIFLAILFGLFIPPPLSAQGATYVVDGSGGIPGSYATIHEVVLMAIAGDTVKIAGMTSGGQPAAYTDATETFPLPVAGGVTVVGFGDPVYIWPVNGNNPDAIFLLSGGTTPTTMARLRIGGGKIGIQMDDVGPSTFVFNKITFSGNTTALSSKQTNGGTTNLTIENCRIVDIATTGTFQNPAIGFLLHAIEETEGEIPILKVDINNLVTSGDFSNTVATAYHSETYADLEAVNNGKASRLIDVLANGSTTEHNGDINTRRDIAEVKLNVNGGILDAGGDSAGDGWDIGVYSALASADPFSQDYTCGTTVTITGATLDGFNIAGVYSTANVCTRGITQLRGQTTILNTGHLFSHSPGEDIRSGVHMFCLEGYLGFTAADSNLVDNTGSGIFLNCPGTASNILEGLQVGLYLGLLRTKIHGNSGCGIEMQASVPNPNPNSNGFAQQAIVGGTWSQDSSSVTKLHSGPPPVAALPTGQGVVADSAISNNGEQGVRVEARGGHGDSLAFCRFSNTFLWNNLLGGYLGHFSTDNQQWADLGTILTPILHCTFAGNGETTGWSIEFTRDVSNTPGFGWDNLGTALPIDFVTEIANPIFQRQNSVDVDFGPFLHSSSVTSVSGTFSPSTKVALGGVRATLNDPTWGASIGTFVESTGQHTSFKGLPGGVGISWGTRKATQFFLDPSVHSDLLETPGWINTSSPETGDDFSGDPRPPVLTDWDKGGEEL